MDLYEISVTPTPANRDTRVLGWKANGAGAAVDDERWALLRTLRDLERRRRDGLLDADPNIPATKSAASPVKVETFTVE